VVLAVSGCARGGPSGGGAGGEALAEARSLAEAGRLDEALQKAAEAPKDAESLYEQGRIWTLKARQAPLPTAAPPVSPLPKGVAPPPPPEFKEEELRAADLFEQALSARGDHPKAGLALAELLAPHAARRHDREKEAARRRRGRAAPPPVAETDTAVDWSVDRALRLFQQAMQAEPASRGPAEALIAFAVRVDRLDAAEEGYQELTRRVKESPEPHVLYGDFLLDRRKDPARAVEQYRQALIWKADDETTRRKLAEIYLTRGADHYRRQEYGMADAQFREAAKYISDPGSDQAGRLQDFRQRLSQLRW
jgi:tetratricopeptide (TPR) repeat protein